MFNVTYLEELKCELGKQIDIMLNSYTDKQQIEILIGRYKGSALPSYVLDDQDKPLGVLLKSYDLVISQIIKASLKC